MCEQAEDQPSTPPPSPASAASPTFAAGHRVTLTERGPFLAPRCSCGWYGPARRSRPLARREAEAHLAATGAATSASD